MIGRHLLARLTVPVLALGIVSLTSCATFSDNANAARVDQVELSNDAIGELLGNDLAEQVGGEVRSSLTKWIRVVLLETANGVPAEQAALTNNLDTRLSEALAAFSADDVDAAAAFYAQGPGVTGTLCLAAIPLDSADQIAEVLASLDGGATFAEAAAEFSTDPGLADNGGVVLGGDGAECYPTEQLSPEILQAVTSVPVGDPAGVELADFSVVVRQRPFDELGDEAKNGIASGSANASAVPELLAGADIYVDPRYGRWNAETAEVEPLAG